MDKSVIEKYELVVGLEVHAQMLTKSKAFSSEANEYGALPNTNVSVITLAHPGTLPKANRKAVEYAVKMGLACNCSITEYNIYDRKNYFYPDLPKGYQITQDKTPICRGGYIDIKTKSGRRSRIRLNRIHMEEDAGKSLHLEGETETLVDLNRAGVPLIEIVTEPDIRYPEEAYAFLTEIRRLVRYLEICDGNMEEGSLRCDANISVRLKGSKELGRKVEVKNMNSITNVQRAIEREMLRQIEIIEKGGTIASETRMYDAVNNQTYSLRTKEALNDYRYFPEPDLPPIIITEEYLREVRAMMPPLPNELFIKFTSEFGLPEYDAGVLTDKKEIALYFLEICKLTQNYKAASNWVMGPIKSYLNELTMEIKEFPLKPSQIVELIELVEQGKISFAICSQRLFPAFIENPNTTALALAEKMNLIQVSDTSFIKPIIEEVLANWAEKVEAYKKGNKNLLGLFMGEVMKKGKGKVDPKVATKLIQEMLDA
ncbi:MAG: Asp-tRNA(Asn)/Glu-tRNA(Gln) amidotransferase subunit GatB [Cytophagales bacterium]|nr:Asp-tRNA(Asn)/Glu-tRNA(Gln) amidotransferase subunit GatB [Cytophagales bacterium]MDW8385070.1 Asp-tRNA(Asn)/Glu-tRNA(Gln) amidotransferase subunit GatB [Flammeovirgaceae bacterium]